MADVGITIAPTRRSVTARLDNKMFEAFCSSFLSFIARIINAFKRIVGREAITAERPEIN